MARITEIKDKIHRMNQASFQIMCDAYLSKKGYKNFVALGTMAGSEKTTPGTPDTYVSSTDGKYAFIEYTTQQASLTKKMREDLEKCLDIGKTNIPHELISEIIYIHNSSNISAKDEHELKDYCKSYGIPLTIIGIDPLAEDLMQHFPSIVRDHLGMSLDTNQVQGIDDFIGQYNNNKTAAPLDTAFLFREKEMEQIAEKLKTVDTVVITAPAGTGKTRFALELARRHAHECNEEIVCIHNQSLAIYEDLRIAFEDPGDYFVIIDDANQLSNLAMIMELFNSLPSDHAYKILITVRDYAIETVREVLEKTIQYDLIKLSVMTDDQIRELVKQHFCILNQKYLDRIAEISDGNPRIAMLAGKTAKESNQFDSIRDVSGLYDAYYGSALQESDISGDSTRLICAGIVAFFGVIHLEHIDPIYKMLATRGITEDIFRRAMHELHSSEMVDIYYDTAVKISDQCFADYVLKHVFYDKKLIPLGEMILTCLKPYHGHTMRAINTLYGKYQNDDMHVFLNDEIKKVWDQLKTEQPDMFWDFVKSFFPVNPLETLIILKEKINGVEYVSIPASQIDISKGKNNVSISDDYITILGGYSRTTNLDAALDLFFTYYLKRPDLYIQFYQASCNYYGVKKNSHEIGYYTQLHYVQKIIQYSENWSNEYITILFLEVMQEYLKLHFETVESGRNDRLIMYQIPLYPSEAATNYRNLIWSQLTAIARMDKQKDRLKELLDNYGHRVEDYSYDVVKSDAPHIIQIVNLILSTDNLLDCLLVKNVSERLLRAGVDTSNLSIFLSSGKMDKYRILVEPDWKEDISFDEMQQIHRESIASYFIGFENKEEVFNDLYEIYLELKPQNYSVITGMKYALMELSSDPIGFVCVSKNILSREDPYGNRLSSCIVYTLFQFMSPAEVKRIINDYTLSQKDGWMYLYFEEMPEERINAEIVQELYTFLREEQMNASKGIPMRDYRFLKKYSATDSKAIIKATEIILCKCVQQPHLVFSYFGGMFIDKKNPYEIIDAYADNIRLLSDLYIRLYVIGHNLDHDGIYLCELLKIDPNIKERIADAIIEFKRRNPYNDTDCRFCALYYTDHYIDTITCLVDRIFEQTKSATIYVPDTLSMFFLVPQEKPNIVCLQSEWATSYIRQNAMNTDKMRWLFRAVANNRLDMMKECVSAFIECNKSFEAFKALTITPTTFESWGSFVPHYPKCIEMLKSLLPLFSGIETIQHKYAVEQEIEGYQQRIRNEEISNIITG